MRHFGTLRSLTQAPPAPLVWERLCLILDEVREPHEFEQAIAYLQGALRRWPDELREVPSRWRKLAATDDRVRRLELTRALHLKQLRYDALTRQLDARGHIFNSVSRLVLDECQVPVDDITGLLRRDEVRQLEYLELGRFPLSYGERFYGQLGTSIAEHPNLTALVLNKNGKQRYWQERLRALLKTAGPSLKELGLPGMWLDEVELGQVSRAVDPSRLEHLDLSNNKLGDYDGGAFEDAHWGALRRLDLSNCSLSDAAIQRLSAVKFPALRELSVAGSRMGPDGLRALTEAEWPSLERLGFVLYGDRAPLRAVLSDAPALCEVSEVAVRLDSGLDAELFEHLPGASFEAVRELDVTCTSPELLVSFLRSRPWERLDRVILRRAEVTGELWRVFESPTFDGVRELTFDRCVFEDSEPYERFGEGVGLPRLESLTYERCKGSVLGAIAGTERLGRLGALHLERSELPEEVLLELFGNAALKMLPYLSMTLAQGLSKESAEAIRTTRHRPALFIIPPAVARAIR